MVWNWQLIGTKTIYKEGGDMQDGSQYKIMFLIYSLAGGGAERMVSRLANAYVTRGFDVTIAIMNTHDIKYVLAPEIKILNLDFNVSNRLVKTLLRIKSLRKYVKKNDIKIIYAFTVSMVSFGVFSCNAHAKVIGVERTNPKVLTKRYQLVIKYLAPKCNGYIFQTNGARMYYPKSVQEKSVVIGNVAPKVKRSDNERKPYSICTMGRLHADKDYPTLLRAMKRVQEEVPESHLYVYGEGELKDRLINVSREIGVANSVSWMGFRENAVEEISQYEIFAFSSKAEGMPNALIEAMVCGLPCVSTDCEYGPADLITDGDNGYLVPVGDEVTMAERIITLLNDRNLCETFRERSKMRMQMYSEENIVNQYINYTNKIYEEGI